jgi:hypothetical protein
LATSIRTNINVNDAAYGRRSISYARSDGPALTAGAFLHARQHHHAGLVSLAIFAVEMQCSSQRNRNRSDCNSMVILRHPSQSRWMSSSRRTTRDPDMRQCNSVEELVQMAYEHLDVLTPRGKSFFWRILSKLLQNRGGRPSGINHKQGPIEKQLDTILRNTLDGMHAFDYRDIATTALGLAKIVIQVSPSRGKNILEGIRIKFYMIVLLGSSQKANDSYSAKLQFLPSSPPQIRSQTPDESNLCIWAR